MHSSLTKRGEKKSLFLCFHHFSHSCVFSSTLRFRCSLLCAYSQKMKEEPNKNYFGLKTAAAMHLNAVWELIRSFIIGYVYGPGFEEGWFSTLARVIGLFIPGIAAHCPTDYVNSVRLGRERSVQMSSF